MIGIDAISELRYGTIESIDDVVSAINAIFLELNIFFYDNDENKILLYDKSYFLNKENINIVKHLGFFIRYTIEDHME